MSTFEGCLVAEKAGWRVPAYAQSMLWVQSGEQAAPAAGPLGKFSLDELNGDLRLTWGVAGGPSLAVWSAPASRLDWQGEVAVSGFVERLHVLEQHGLELVIAEIEGDRLPAGYSALPTLEQMRCAPFSRRDAPEMSAAREHTYTLIMLADSVHAEYIHHAMVSELAVDCFASLGPQDGHWHEIVGLPLLVESLSLLAPGYR
jgi:hypothetical protein